MEFSEKGFYDESETDAEYSDDSEEDPDFNVLEENRLTLSNLSLKRRSKRLKSEGMDEKEEKEELNEQDQRSYEIIREIVEGGHVNRLKVDQCKIYLRKYGLRLSGSKETLIQRIKEHIDIINGGGEKKYPAYSFVLNCKGDACTGDVVMFRQKVYKEFSIISRSAKGGPSGTRVVAGRILKESYGAVKQQHTFTIEVLWSKGKRPLPPLYPLLIKGRNLYRLKTRRQRWNDEGERQRILLEKHARGGAARLIREARLQQKERRKMQKQTRKPLQSNNVKSDKLTSQPKKKQQQQEVHCCTTILESNVPIQLVNLHGRPDGALNALMQPFHQRQPLISKDRSFEKGHLTGSQFADIYSSKDPTWKSYYEPHVNYHTIRSPIRGHPLRVLPNFNQQGCSSMRIPLCGFGHESTLSYSQQRLLNAARNPPFQQQEGNEQRQKCQYFVRGRRCYFGDRCKFLHEL